jgi:outer membrane protein assembly factor BamB
MKLRIALAGIIVLALLGPTVVRADDAKISGLEHWPRWRGPLANGIVPQGDPPLEFGEDKNLQWKVSLPGEGTSSPVIWGHRLFLLSAEPSGADHPRGSYDFNVLCYDRNSGELLWSRTARREIPHEGHHKDHGYASYSPVTDGERLYVSFGSRGVHCFDLDGNRLWEQDLGKMRTRMGFGEGSSPALHDGLLFINWDHEGESSLFALDAKTGDIRWQVSRDERSSWSTPVVVEHDGRHELVVHGTQRVRSYEPATGELIWEVGGQTANVIPMPVAGHGMVFVTSGFRGSMLQAIELGHRGDLTGTDAIRWSVTRATPYVPSPLLYDDLIYVFNSNRAILSCYDALSGEPHYVQERLPEMTDVYASPVGVAGRIYLTGRDGVVLVLNNAPELEVLARNRLDDRIDASPAVIGDTLYFRGSRYLYKIAAD